MAQNDDNQDFHGFGKPPSFDDEQESEVGQDFDAEPEFMQENEQDDPVLSDSLPSLSRGGSSNVNKKALAFIGVVGLCVLTGIFLIYKNLTGGATEVKVEKEEELFIPDKPTGIAPPPLFNQAQQEPLDVPLEDPLDLNMASEPVPANNNLSFAEKPPTLAERRVMGNSGSVVSNNQGGNQNSSNGMLDNLLPGGLGANNTSGNPEDMAAAYLSEKYGIGSDGNPIQAAGSTKPDIRRMNNRDTVMLRGTYIRCILETKIVSTLAGPTACVVTNPIYSASGRKLLIPRGSKVLGTYDLDASGLNDRVAVVWDRVITPNGLDINLGGIGIDQLGSSGHPGKYRAYWGRRLGAALLVSLTADVFNYAGIKYGPTVKRTIVQDGSIITEEQPFESKAADVISQMPEQMLARTLNKPATVTVNQGALINIYASKDIDFATVLD
ncbi:TrbI/VirB10 family protein [Neisseria sp. Ec49-e6-T10]|uniref:TrbI/VirB10 family protein n=1 Tax=Neisseria sp. Ec49-e6-T10 TaxID=3140744 RepID=UPI003EBB29EC